MPSYRDSGWKPDREDEKDFSDYDYWDIAEQIKKSVAESTAWIGDMIADIRDEFVDQIRSQRYEKKTPEQMREEARQRAQMQTHMQELTRKREELKKRIADIPGWKSITHSVIQLVFGIMTVCFGAMTVAFLCLNMLGWRMPGAFVFFTMMTVVCGIFTGYSTRRRRQLKRFVRYIGMIHDKLYVNIEDFIHSLGYSKKTVLKDLRTMIELKILKQGHIDSQGKYLMLTDETYSQYVQSQESYKSRVIEEEKNLSDLEKHEREELERILAQGRAYIKQIREANDELPAEDISAKLDRLETVAGQVFATVKGRPEKVSEIRKFMDYYLPTTMKLVKSYQEFETQPVQGENIKQAKKEIEDTLDMINLAFENLSDRLYQDVTMEVSADISVLKTLLAQEGLKEKDFVIK